MGEILAMIGAGLMIGLSGAGSAWGLGIGGSAVIGTIKKKPESFGLAMALSSMPATQGLYGFVAYIIYSGVIKPELTIANGGVVLGAGIGVGFACLFSAIHQGKVCASGINAMGSGHNVFANTLIMGAFPEFYAILALVAGILMKGLIAA
ncbi:MAG TPA: ATPase [Spirochaetota bacterium]|nr:ATPase [Spirochaetota bacterium]